MEDREAQWLRSLLTPSENERMNMDWVWKCRISSPYITSLGNEWLGGWPVLADWLVFGNCSGVELNGTEGWKMGFSLLLRSPIHFNHSHSTVV